MDVGGLDSRMTGYFSLSSSQYYGEGVGNFKPSIMNSFYEEKSKCAVLVFWLLLLLGVQRRLWTPSVLSLFLSALFLLLKDLFTLRYGGPEQCFAKR